MDTIFMNFKNSLTSDSHRLLINLTDEINLRRSYKYVPLSNLSIHYAWKNIKKFCKNHEFKISAPTWIDKLELPDGSYSVSYIQDYFEYIFRKHGEKTDNPSEMIYVNKIENRITFKIKTGYYLTLETMRLLESTKNEIIIVECAEKVPTLEITEAVLVHCNTVNNYYWQDWRVLYTFAPNKSFGQLLDILLKNFIFLKTFLKRIFIIELWFTDQSSKLRGIEGKVNITLIINYTLIIN